MGEKASYQYFSNISQRINQANDLKSSSIENLQRAPVSRSNETLNQSWFATLTGGRRGRLTADRGKRQNSCTSSEAGSLNLEGSNSNKSFSNSLASKNGSVDEKANTISNLNDAREPNSCNTAVALRNSTKSNRSSNRTVQELRKQSKEVDDSESAYYRYSPPEPFDLVPSQLFIQQYLEYLRQNNLELDFDQLNLTYLNYLNQLNQVNRLRQSSPVNQNVSQLNQFGQLNQSSLLGQLNQPNQVAPNQPNPRRSERPNPQFNPRTLPIATSQPFLPSPFASHSNRIKTSSATSPQAAERELGRQRTSEATSSSSAATEQQSDNKPQLVQCPQLAAERVESSGDRSAQLSENSNEYHEQPAASEQRTAKQTESANQPICDELRKLENLQLAASESDSKKSKKFKLVKELFDADAHLYMSVEQMTAMEELIRNNPRTCVIYLSNSNEELGFNLITKKKPHFAHIVKKVNPNLVSAKAGLQENDQLLMVNNVDCRNLAHQQVVKLLGKRERKLKLVVCQPSVYQWYLNEGYELKLDYDVEQDENEQQNEQDRGMLIGKQPEKDSVRRKQLSELNEPQRPFDYQQQPPIKYNERCVDDARPIQALPDQAIPYADTDNSYKDNRINSPDDPLSTNRNSGFKRSYKLKKKPAHPFVDDAVDDSLSMSTSVSPFDEKYGELRDEIFNPSQSVKSSAAKNKGNLNGNLNAGAKNYPTSLSNKSLSDNYNYESKKLEYNEYMDGQGAHKLEKSETLVEIQNDEFKNKKITRKSVEKLHKTYDDQPMKNVLPTCDSKPAAAEPKSGEKPAARSPYTPVYGKTSLFSNSLFDKSKTATTSSIFDKPKDRPTSIFDRPSIFDRLNASDQVTSTSKTSYYSSPTQGGKTYNTSSYNNQSYSSQSFSKNESSSYSKSYISPTTKYSPTSATTYKSPYDDNRQTLVKEPLIERHVIEPKAAELVHIYDEQESARNQTKPLRTQQAAKSPAREATKPLRKVQANSADDLPSPRMCTLKLPRDRIVSFGFTIKTSRKTNAKLVVDIVRNSIAHRAGLRVNDIIVEVNEAFVGQDTHQQVTDRIKAHAADEVRLLVVTEAEAEIYRNHGLVPSSEQANVIYVEYDSELMMPLHANEVDEEDCLKGCGSFLDNLTAKQYRTYLQSSKKRPEPANSPVEFQEKIKKFEKL